MATWSGVRPLLQEDHSDVPGTVSRDHRIVRRDDGVVTIAGGKLTTHRRMAQECVDEVALAVALAGGAQPTCAVRHEVGRCRGP